MTHIIIPEWVPPVRKPVDATGQAPPRHGTAGARGSTPADLQIQTLGRDQIIPIVYGGPERMAGLVYCVATPKAGPRAGQLVFAMILCEGPVDSVYDFRVNGEPLPSFISVTTYTGAPGQGVDPWLAQAIPGFNETLPGVAYFVARVAKHDLGFPPITALVKGLKVLDPRVTFYHVWSDIFTNWIDPASPVGYVPNSRPARDGTMTAHSLLDLDANPATPAHRDWSWLVPNDALTRRVSISINKEVSADHGAGIGLAYSGGVPLVHLVRLDLVTGAVTVVSGGGATVNVIDHPAHWEVLLSLANNATGNTALTLALYPDL